LLESWNARTPTGGRTFTLRVRARDESGNTSAPTDVSFTLRPGAAAVAAPQSEVTELGGAGPLPAIARALASRVAQAGTPEFFDAYKYALAEPERCDAGGSPSFLDHYRAAATRFRTRLNSGNISTFYSAVCASWIDALDRSREAAAQSESERLRVMAANAMARSSAEAAAAQARTLRNAALGFAFSAVIAFMMIALFLAFMAIEGHSAAVRSAIELLAADRRTSHEEP
jgi:hypothetical protein